MALECLVIDLPLPLGAIAYGWLHLFVIPAKAGIQGCKSSLVALDPGFRRGDDKNKQWRKS